MWVSFAGNFRCVPSRFTFPNNEVLPSLLLSWIKTADRQVNTVCEEVQQREKKLVPYIKVTIVHKLFHYKICIQRVPGVILITVINTKNEKESVGIVTIHPRTELWPISKT
jgi:hypothetical protein